ncbi:hypothetical protein INT45_003716 [Circinella minor]|uniref:Uncharacterized protein n=1 Tax=Circinella minor TaxID=1195481 RepID=A0A8H7S8J2_9FUNG|nr:hypothetical protein INT45_003716 [Circinella minor]
MSGGSINKLMAMDMTGTIGYLYLLEFKNGTYVASVINSIILTQESSELELFKVTVETLFIWRNFLDDLAKTMKRSEIAAAASSIVRKRISHDDPDSTPMVNDPTKNRVVPSSCSSSHTANYGHHRVPFIPMIV